MEVRGSWGQWAGLIDANWIHPFRSIVHLKQGTLMSKGPTGETTALVTGITEAIIRKFKEAEQGLHQVT